MINLYDIKLDANKNIYLELYTIDVITLYQNGRNQNCYDIKSKEIEYPVDIKERIAYLRAIGFNSILTVFPRNFDVVAQNPFDIFSIMMLQRRNILLDKVYDKYDIADGMNITTLYIHYIDSITGVEYAKSIGSIDAVLDEDDNTQIEKLENMGFTPIENSILLENNNALHDGFLPVELDVSSRKSVIQK